MKEVSAVCKTRVWTDRRVFDRSYHDGLNGLEWGRRTRGGGVPVQRWFWYIGFGGGSEDQSGLTDGGGGRLRSSHWEGLGISSCGEAGEGAEEAISEVLVLTAVMHGVAGDDHWRGHGNGSAAHGELVGDRIVSTTAAWARLACRGSLHNACAHDGAHPGVGVVYNSCVHQGDEVVVRH